MELKEFVTEALIQFQEGVQEAIGRRGENTKAVGIINPVWTDLGGKWDQYVQKIEFDVAVTVADKSAAGGKGSIKIFSVAEVGGGLSKSEERTTVSRIRFTVPVVPPAQMATAKV